MSNALAVPASDRALAETPDLNGKSTEELAQLANREYEASYAAVASGLEHAIRSGEALLAAKEGVPVGGWANWLSENFAGAQATAQQFMRLAHHRHSIEVGLTVKDAYRSIAGLPAIDAARRRGRKALPYQGTVDQAEAMRRDGMTRAAIGEAFDVSANTVRLWLDPELRARIADEKRRRYHERRAVQAELSRRRRDSAVRRAGGGTAEVYSLVRRAAQKAEAHRIDNAGSEISAALRKTINHLHAAEDEIVRALGVE